jgi:hypothetical protein
LASHMPFGVDSPDLTGEVHLRFVKMAKFVAYLRTTWIEDLCLFRRDKWNLFHIDCHRTNNNMEGWHHGIQHKFGRSKFKPKLIDFLTFLQREEADWCLNLVQVHMGAEIKETKKKYVKLQKRFVNMKAVYKSCALLLDNIDNDMNYVLNLSYVMASM